MKKIVLLILATTTLSTQPFFFEHYFLLKKGAQEQREAVDELSKNRADIRVGRNMTYPGRGAIPTRMNFYTEAADKSFVNYLKAEGSLAARIFASQFVDGFLLGVLAACCNAQLDFPIPIACALVATAIAIIKHQNNRLGSVPFFDDHFKLHKFEYTMWNIQTLLNVGCILLAAKLGADSVNQFIPDQHSYQARRSLLYL